jgi:hypothetical protein
MGCVKLLWWTLTFEIFSVGLFLIHFSPFVVCSLYSDTSYFHKYLELLRDVVFLRSFSHTSVGTSLLYYAFAFVFSLLLLVGIAKDKAVPLQAWSGPEGSMKLRFPDFMTTAQDGGKVVSLKHRPPLPPGNTPGTHLC